MKLTKPTIFSVVCALILSTLVTVAANAQVTNTVETQGTTFVPKQIGIDPSESVTWIARSSPHNITSEDGSFQSPNLGTNDTFAHTFETVGVFAYYCSFHGAPGGVGMSGEVFVGTAIPTPTPTPTPIPPPTINVPADVPTISAALAIAEPASLIKVAPGTHAAPLLINVTDVTIQGTGLAPSQPVLTTTSPIRVIAPGVTLNNLRIAGATNKTALSYSANEWTLDEVEINANLGRIGVEAMKAQNAVIRESSVTGFDQGIKVSECDECSLLVDQTEVIATTYGLIAQNAGPLNVIRSTFSGAAVGIRAGALGSSEPLGHIWGNTIDATDVGIWLGGAIQTDTENNVINTLGTYGIAITGPSAFVSVFDNTVESTAGTGIAWDGVGFEVCFDNNDATYIPPTLPTTNNCGDDGLPIGVPYPLLTAELFARYGP